MGKSEIGRREMDRNARIRSREKKQKKKNAV